MNKSNRGQSIEHLDDIQFKATALLLVPWPSFLVLSLE